MGDVGAFDPDDLLDVVRASPRLVGIQDRTAWLGLFSEGAVVEDPVGTPPHVRSGMGDDPLERFWDTFIAGNDIRFHVHRDIVWGNEVVRDVCIETRFPSGFTLEVPAHLHYVLTRHSRSIRIDRLAAHWEQPHLLARASTGGFGALRALTGMGARMARSQGPAGVVGYLGGAWRGIGRRGHVAAARLAAAVRDGDEAGLVRQFAGGGRCIELPIGAPLAPTEIPSLGITRFEVSNVIAAGWTTSFRFAIEAASGPISGIAFLAFAPGTRKILAARFFC